MSKSANSTKAYVIKISKDGKEGYVPTYGTGDFTVDLGNAQFAETAAEAKWIAVAHRDSGSWDDAGIKGEAVIVEVTVKVTKAVKKIRI